MSLSPGVIVMTMPPSHKRIMAQFLAATEPLVDVSIAASPNCARVQVYNLRRKYGLELPLTSYGLKSYSATLVDKEKIEKLLVTTIS